MPPKINEALIEETCLQQLEAVGWRHEYGKNLPTADGDFARGGMAGVVFTEQLRQAVARLNPDLPPEAVEDVVRVVTKSEIGDLLERNRAFYTLLRNGVPVSYRTGGEAQTRQAMLVDFENPQANAFVAVNQLEIRTAKGGKRIPDVILFVNGLPLVVLELKHPLNEKADLRAAFNQLQTYKDDIPDLFVFNQLLVVSDGTEARIGSLSADWQRFTPWRVVDETANSARLPFVDELAGVVEGLLRPETLLDYLRFFVLFERDARGQFIKKCAAYHQFYGVNAAVAATLAASSADGDGRIGVMWHTQGSGKSISMLFYAGKLLAQRALQNPTLVVVTDRSDLDGQLFQTFDAGQELLKQAPVQVDSREGLRDALAERAAGGVLFTTVQKFAPREDEEHFPALNTRRNIIVISDEAHRSQYGFAMKVGSGGQMRAGYARHLRDALPNASFIGFTGTPLSLEDKDTQEVFGRYVSVYDLQDAVADGATVPIVYEARQIRLHFDEAETRALFDALEDDDEGSAKLRLREHILGADARLRDLAADLVAHFAQRNQVAPGKAMVVAVSRRVCVDLYKHIIALRPDWHSDDINGGAIKIIMTGAAGDPPEFQPHLYSREEKKTLEKRFKDPDDPLQIVIVRDMWLTGFDAPCCHTMYLDKPMQGHNLMQAIARVNRVFRNKSRENGGLVVDYIGLTDELKKATQRYSRDGGKGEMTRNIGDVFTKMQEHLDVVRGQFASPVNGSAFDVAAALAAKEPQALLAHIRRAAEHISALDHANRDAQRKKAFLEHVRLAKKGFALCGTLAKTAPYREELAFYDAVRAVLAKRDGGGAGGDRLLQLTALINQSIVSEGVIDLFDLLGKPQARLDLLSDDFLRTVKTSDTPHLWVAAAERYLQAKIRETAGNNLAAQKDFSERLQAAMNRYNNHNLSVVEVLDELVKLARELQERLARGEKLGLSEAELAFYDALARNQSAREQMAEAVLAALAKEITEQLRKSASIDWKFKDGVKAKMRLLVKRALRAYKYPPDAEAAAVEFVLEQAEEIADGLLG